MFTAVKIRRTARGREPVRNARAAARPVAHTESATAAQASVRTRESIAPHSRSRSHEHRPVVRNHRPRLLAMPAAEPPPSPWRRRG